MKQKNKESVWQKQVREHIETLNTVRAALLDLCESDNIEPAEKFKICQLLIEVDKELNK